jgi:heptaprenyl diphosphate synthase
MMLTPQPGRAERHTVALLGSLCLFLSAIEYLIPKPLPFMRIGLANLPLLLALDMLSSGNFFLLALIKVLGQGIIGGTFFSWVFLFSLAGTFSSAALMYSLRGLLGKNRIGFAGLGCAGAMASNGIQLLLARYLIFGPALRYLAPPFLASGFITGIALGLVCEYFCRHSRWYAEYIRNKTTEYTELHGGKEESHIKNSLPTPHSLLPTPQSPTPHSLFFAGLTMALIFLLGRSLPARAVQFLFFCVFVRLMGKKVNPLITITIMAGIVFFNLLAPYGKVLAVLGPLRITQGSLFAGLEKALTLEGLLMLSRACIRSDLRLPGTIGSLLGESLRNLELMRGKKGLIRRGHIIAGIDQMLREVETVNAAEPSDTPQPVPPRNIKNILLLSAMVAVTAGIGVVLNFSLS